MALVVKDRVKETTTTTGTGTLTLLGAATGFQAFSVIGDGNTTYYTITNGTDWEVGIGTYTSSGTTLSRDTILESSNSGSAVNWGAGTKDVFVTYPAEKAVYFNAADQLDVDNLRLDGNTLSSTNTDGNVVLDPNGTGSVDVSSAKIINVALPTNNTDAANKEYVDEVAEGLRAKPAVELATTANLTATYDNGPSNDGVGATLTATTNGAFPTIDGVTLTSTTLGQNGVLVKNQTAGLQNGRYNLTTVGDGSNPWVLTRCALCDESDEIPGAYVFVKDGTLYAGTGWVQVVTDPATFQIGVDPIFVFQFSGAGTYTAGAGLDLNGTEFSVETNGITDAMLRQSAGLSVIGRSANSTGNVADITATSDDEVLRRSGTSIGFGSVATGGIADNAVTDAKIRDSAALSVIGNATNSTANPADIAAASDHQVLRRSGTALGFGAVALNQSAAVTGALPFDNGGTGQTTQQAAMNALAGAITSGQYLRGNGTNVVMSSIQAGDVPTLNQNTTGNAATATALQTARTINGVSFNGTANITVADATKLPLAGGTMTGLLIGRETVGADVNTNNDTGSFSVRSNSTNAASMSFHRTGAFAINMGLGTDNVFRIGGWSATANAFQMSSGGNLTMAGTVAGTNITAAGSVTSLNASHFISRTGSSGNLNTDFQNTPAGTTRIQGDDAGGANGAGGTWWFYQNMRHSNGTNFWGTQVAWGWEDNANTLRTRNVSANSFGGWVTYVNSVNLNSFLNAPGSPPVYAARAWVNFNGVGGASIRASGNVSSVTRNAAGNYTVNFTTAMPDANYSVAGVAQRGSGDSNGDFILPLNGAITTSGVQVAVRTTTNVSTLIDALVVCVSVFR